LDRNIEYIVVDLDGALIRTDLFFESVLKLIKSKPLYIFNLVFWLFLGRSQLKERIAGFIDINPEILPYEKELINYLKAKKAQGAFLILATASNQKYAKVISDYLGIFDCIIASDSSKNLKGKKKLEAIRECIGGSDFTYAGDSNADAPIWEEAAGNIFVNAPRRHIVRSEQSGKAEKIFKSKRALLHSFLKEMRLHHWAKNVLIFVPLITSHNYHHVSAWIITALAFTCFSLCASGVYFLNDLLDLDSDRLLSGKRNRPLASGDLPITVGIGGALCLFTASFIIAWQFLPVEFFIVLIVYFAITDVYSFYLKKIAIADVMTLAVLYTLRIVAGSLALGFAPTFWLLAFSVFIFLSLAYLKRYIEISSLSSDEDIVHGRGYCAADIEPMFSLGISNVTASVLVLAFYINTEEVKVLYSSPVILWVLCLLTLYWGNRIWVHAKRGFIKDDPFLYVLKDRVSQIVGLAFLAVVLAARFF